MCVSFIQRKRKRDAVREFIRNLASLSLEDYKWRSALFKEQEADRKMEESLARMRGEEPAYVRPMDATEDKIGPLVSYNINLSCRLQRRVYPILFRQQIIPSNKT